MADPQNLVGEEGRHPAEFRPWDEAALAQVLEAVRLLLADVPEKGYLASARVWRPPILLPRLPGDKGETHGKGNLRIEIEVEMPRRSR